MGRVEIILSRINKNEDGIEIGPSHNPIAPKRLGWKTTVIDHIDKSGLIKKFEACGVNTSSIEDVDFIWSGQKYVDLVGRDDYGWIVASHVVEHVPDLISFLQSCEGVLSDSGVLSLAIPDKRFCFDCYRPVSGIGQILDAHFSKKTSPSPGDVFEFNYYNSKRNGQSTWNMNTPIQKNEMEQTLEFSLNRMDYAKLGNYADVHVWGFTPHSFRLIIDTLNKMGIIKLKEVDMTFNGGFEFFMTLSKTGDGYIGDREELFFKMFQESVAIK